MIMKLIDNEKPAQPAETIASKQTADSGPTDGKYEIIFCRFFYLSSKAC